MSVSPARRAAFEILLRIERDEAFSSVLLDNAASRLSPRDGALCYELTLGTLRRRMWLDRVIDGFTKGRKLDPQVRIALRLGIYQLQFLNKIPSYSAISESVDLTQAAGKTSAKGLVNAVLRRVQRGVLIEKSDDVVAELSLNESHPRWLVEKWIGDLGLDDASAFIRANNKPPPVAFRLTAASTHRVNELLAEASASEFMEGCFLADAATEPLRALAASGEIYFQDEASQMAANSLEIRDGSRIIDVCAAPGGKITSIIRRSRRSQLSVFAVAGDRYAPRIRVLKDNCLKQNTAEIAVIQYDAEAPLPLADRSFDAVLVDAPCSGTGTIRRNPEIRYKLTPDDFIELPKKQLNILKNASKLVASGGNLVYSTCSIEPEENEEVCNRFLEAAENFELAPLKLNARFITSNGFGRTFPHRDRTDGFFIAAFRRREAK